MVEFFSNYYSYWMDFDKSEIMSGTIFQGMMIAGSITTAVAFVLLVTYIMLKTFFKNSIWQKITTIAFVFPMIAIALITGVLGGVMIVAGLGYVILSLYALLGLIAPLLIPGIICGIIIIAIELHRIIKEKRNGNS